MSLMYVNVSFHERYILQHGQTKGNRSLLGEIIIAERFLQATNSVDVNTKKTD